MSNKISIPRKAGDPSAISIEAVKNLPELERRIKEQFSGIDIDTSKATGRTETPKDGQGKELPPVYLDGEIAVTKLPDGVSMEDVTGFVVRFQPTKTIEQEEDERKAIEILRLLGIKKKELKDLLSKT